MWCRNVSDTRLASCSKADLRRPDIRDTFITSPEILRNDDCTHTLTAMMSVNWPWSPVEVVYLNQKTNELQISYAFELYA